MNKLNSIKNRYGGILVSSSEFPKNVIQFETLLVSSLEVWRAEKVKVVWLKLTNNRVDLLPVLYQAGFENHHCDPVTITLTKRLEEGAVIPPYANHTIGVGGLVINQKNELLTIRELAHIKTHPDNWKFPGGMLDPYEHFEAGVKREVFEETGIRTDFQSLIGFRHHHIGQFATSNIYAVCRLIPLNNDIEIQESEIFDARWYPIDEYLANDKIGQYNQTILRSALEFSGLKSVKLPSYLDSDDAYEVFVSRVKNQIE